MFSIKFKSCVNFGTAFTTIRLHDVDLDSYSSNNICSSCITAARAKRGLPPTDDIPSLSLRRSCACVRVCPISLRNVRLRNVAAAQFLWEPPARPVLWPTTIASIPDTLERQREQKRNDFDFSTLHRWHSGHFRRTPTTYLMLCK